MKSSSIKNILIITLAIAVVGLAAWGVWLTLNKLKNTGQQQQQSPQQPTATAIIDFSSCAVAGNPIKQTNPRTCTANGITYTEKTTAPQPATMAFTSPKGVIVRLHDWAANGTITSPATITGEIPGNWSFEASFPVILADSDGKIIAQQPAHLQGDWMTTNDVPFTVTLTFTAPATDKNGTLILRKDNPSGLPQNDDAIKIPITF